jgi:hypothetical protein
MTLSDWSSQLCDELSQRIVQELEARSDSSRFERISRPLDPQPRSGCFFVDLGQYGIHIMADDPEVLVWLLDAEGRTSGPIWCDKMTAETIPAAAAQIANVLKEAPSSDSFTGRPPTGRDASLEATVNALWQTVQEKIDGIEFASLDDAQISDAIECLAVTSMN